MLSVVEKRRQKNKQKAHLFKKISNNQKYRKFPKGSEIFFIPKCIGSKTGRFYAKCDLTMLDIDRILNKKIYVVKRFNVNRHKFTRLKQCQYISNLIVDMLNNKYIWLHLWFYEMLHFNRNMEIF